MARTALNDVCLQVLQELIDRAAKFGITEPEHFVFPRHGKNKQFDPTRAMTSWRQAWRALRKAAGSEARVRRETRNSYVTVRVPVCRSGGSGDRNWLIREAASFGTFRDHFASSPLRATARRCCASARRSPPDAGGGAR
jgi:hypothetical protein